MIYYFVVIFMGGMERDLELQLEFFGGENIAYPLGKYCYVIDREFVQSANAQARVVGKPVKNVINTRLECSTKVEGVELAGGELYRFLEKNTNIAFNVIRFPRKLAEAKLSKEEDVRKYSRSKRYRRRRSEGPGGAADARGNSLPAPNAGVSRNSDNPDGCGR